MINDQGLLLRSGFTTGTCATAAAKAATLALLGHSSLKEVSLYLPSGEAVTLPVHAIIKNPDHSFTAIVIKDAGDDADVTDGIEIHANASLTPQVGEIDIQAGKGIGKVTKPGLQVPVGQAAINPKPRQMIKDNLKDYVSTHGLKISLSVPQGELIAKKTYNARLGIIGGISIIGTTGIVRPMSEDAYKKTIYYEMNQKKKLGLSTLVLVPGKHGENYAVHQLGYSQETIVNMSNFVGFSLNTAVALGFHQIDVIGHIGKLIKLAGGIFQTHSQVADGKKEIIIAHLALEACPLEILKSVYEANTTDEIADLLFQTDYAWIFPKLSQIAQENMANYIHHEAKIHLEFYDMKLRNLSRLSDLHSPPERSNS